MFDTPFALIGCVILIAIAVGAWRQLHLAWLGLRRGRALEAVGRTLVGPSIVGRSGARLLVGGLLQGRSVRVEHEGENYVTCSVQLEHALDGLSVYPVLGSSQRFLDRQRRTGRMSSLGQEHLDSKYAVQGGAQGEATRLFEQDLEPDLDALFGPLGVMRLTTANGWLTARRRVRRRSVLDPDEALRTLRALQRLAPAFSRREVQIQLQGRSYALTAESGEGLLCPYCRDTLDPGGEEPLARCEACHTVHHQECYEEAGGCTVLGCAAQARGRRRSRV